MNHATGIEILRAFVDANFDNLSAFARKIGKPQSSVYELLSGERKKIPAEWCAKIEDATRGKITRQQLRPDLWPDEAAQ